jgi:hypothetical protein
MDERQAIDALSQVGFTTHRYRRNFGHNTRRITLMARRRSDQSQSAPETSRLTA